ncbi:unnamed protein product [Coccothraustes coccothraustes]
MDGTVSAARAPARPGPGSCEVPTPMVPPGRARTPDSPQGSPGREPGGVRADPCAAGTARRCRLPPPPLARGAAAGAAWRLPRSLILPADSALGGAAPAACPSAGPASPAEPSGFAAWQELGSPGGAGRKGEPSARIPLPNVGCRPPREGLL